MPDLSGRCILVTGAGGGLGTELCRFLVECGARVLATDIDDEKGQTLLESVPGGTDQLFYAPFDQSQVDGIAAFVDQLAGQHGRPDSLVNNAAVYPLIPAYEMDEGDFARVQQVNVVAAAAFMRACVPAMKAASFGRIINVASITFDLGYRDLSAYVASKGALIGLVRSWSRELGADSITVNAISPGGFQTDAEKIHPDPEAYSQWILDQQSIKRRGKPADFAHVAGFLLDRQTSFVTGQTIRVDGGWVTQ